MRIPAVATGSLPEIGYKESKRNIGPRKIHLDAIRKKERIIKDEREKYSL